MKVLVIESSYETCAEAMARAFAAFPLDAVLARMVGFRIDEVPYLRIARELGLGRTDPDAIEIEGDGSPIKRFHRPVITPESTWCYLSGVGGGKTSRAFYADRVCYRPVIAAEKCPPGCTVCADACPSGALRPGRPPVFPDHRGESNNRELSPISPALASAECMLCSACMEACPHDALRLLPNK